MAYNIPLSVVNSVLDDYPQPSGLYIPSSQQQRTYNLPLYPPPGLYKQQNRDTNKTTIHTDMERIVHTYKPYEPIPNVVNSSTLADIKFKLEYELVTAKQKIIEIEFNLSKVTELINAEKIVKENQEINKTPTQDFISEIYKLFTKESPIQLSNIPHKLPEHVLPPKGHTGLFSNWLEQVPGLRKETITKNSKQLHLYYLESEQIKKQLFFNKMCWQKKRGKPCNNFNEKGECKFCTVGTSR